MNIVITGAGSGIGFQAALILSANSENYVFAISRNKENLDQLKAESIKQNPASKLFVISGDITDEQAIAKITDEIKINCNMVHILINNAGLLITKPFESLTMLDWKNVYSTNVFGTINMIRQLLPLLETAGSIEAKSHILNISSIGGFQGSIKFKGLVAYSSAKAAMVSITECLAEEFKDRNIAVNCLCLGSVQTEMFSAAFPSMKASATVREMATYISTFAIEGQKYFNGKIIPVSNSTP